MMNKLSLMLAFCVGFPLCSIARYLRIIAKHFEKEEGNKE